MFGYDDNGLKVLLIDSHFELYKGKQALLGDLLRNDENLKEAALRILYERTGLTEVYLDQVRSFSRPDRHPMGRVVTFAYYALIKIDDYKIDDQAERQLRWVPIDQIGQLAFDHNEILEISHQKLQQQLRDKPIGFSLLPEKFSLMQLQTLYETVLGIQLDKRNFRRKLQSLKVLIDLGETQQSVSHRPAKLYSFDKSKMDIRLSI